MLALRPYQEAAVAAVYRHLAERSDNPCVVIPTGGGKSPVLSKICADVVERWNGRVLVLTHVKELVDQNATQAARFLSPLLVGVNSAGLKRRDLDHPVIVAGIQSVYQKACDLGRFDVILIDECHLIPQEGEGMYQTFLRDARLVNPHVRVVGLTATPFRLKDGPICAPENILNHVCFEVGVKELIRDGFLSPLISKAGKAKADTSHLHVRGGEFVADEVEDLMDEDGLVRAACAEIAEHTRARRACLIFAAGVSHAEHVAAVLREQHDMDVACIFGHTPDSERDRLVGQFKSGSLRCLVNVAVLTTGFDAPHVDCVALLRPTLSAGLYYQMCLDMETEVLTRSGWRRCHAINVGDEVGTFDRGSGEIVWSSAREKVHRPLAPGESMYGIQSPHLDIRVTDRHTMIYRGRSATCRHWRTKDACELSGYRDSFLIPVSGTNEGSGLPLSDDEIRFLGWVFTDGYRNPHNNAVVICQSAASPYLSAIESMLDGCGFGYRRYQRRRQGVLARYPDAVTFVIPHGKPRGANRNQRGWAHLAPYLDQPILDSLKDISQQQVEVLLEAMNLADGAKPKPSDWTPRTRTIAIGQHRFLADQLQILLIQRGYRCNLSVQRQRSTWHKNEPAESILLRVRRQTTATIGGATQTPSRLVPHRSRFASVPFDATEWVWCLTTDQGTLVTRRNGKVAIVGNCGRGFRLAPDKSDCLVLDFGGNVLRHGPVDAITIADKDSRESGQAPAKECPQCQAVIAAGFATCPQCGFQFPPPERDKHEREASSAGVLTGQVTINEYAVRDTFFAVHEKRGAPLDAPKSLRVEYEISLNRYQKEWVCFEHTGFARGKAEAWWRARSRDPVPSTAAEACRLANAGVLAPTTSITVRTVAGEEFERITDYRFGSQTLPREPGDDPDEPAITAALPSSVYDDEPPF